MKAKTILILLIVLFQIVDVNAQFQRHPNLNNAGKVPKTGPYRFLQADTTTGRVFPDSALFLRWNKNKADWDTVRFEIYSYDQNYNTTRKVIKVLDSARTNFIVSIRTDYTYNKGGKCVEEFTQQYRKINWIDSTRIIRTYDVNDQCIEKLYQRIDTSGWLSYSRNFWKYDSYGNMIETYWQDWMNDIYDWVTISGIQWWEYTYNGNKIVRAQNGTYSSYPQNYAYSDDYKFVYKNGESNPSEVIYDYKQSSLIWGIYYYTEIYKDVIWNNGFGLDKVFSVGSEADYIRQDSISIPSPTNLRNNTKRISFKKDGMTSRDSIFSWYNESWIDSESTSFNYNSKQQPTLTIKTKNNNTPNWDTEYIWKRDYDNRGNEILDFYQEPHTSLFNGTRTAFEYVGNTNEIVSVTTENFGYNEYATKVIYYPSQQLVGIKQQPDNNTAIVYPNPSSDLINLRLNSDRKYSTSGIQIIDINGKVMMEKQIQLKVLIPETINISDLNPGLYFIILTLDNSKQYLKLIKQ